MTHPLVTGRMTALLMTQCAWLTQGWLGTGMDDFGRLPSSMPGEHACPALLLHYTPSFLSRPQKKIKKLLFWSHLCRSNTLGLLASLLERKHTKCCDTRRSCKRCCLCGPNVLFPTSSYRGCNSIFSSISLLNCSAYSSVLKTTVL